MQQDRSTGWRLGSNRAIQFRYQAVGIVMGAVLCVVLAQLFMSAYPVLRVDTFTHPEARVGIWQSAMTFKFVGAIRGMGHLAPYQVTALGIGFAHRLRSPRSRASCCRARRATRRFVASGRAASRSAGRRRVLLLQPLRLLDGRLPEIFDVALWFAAGSVAHARLLRPRARGRRAGARRAGRRAARGHEHHRRSIGGGLIAGESLYTLGAGIAALLALV